MSGRLCKRQVWRPGEPEEPEAPEECPDALARWESATIRNDAVKRDAVKSGAGRLPKRDLSGRQQGGPGHGTRRHSCFTRDSRSCDLAASFTALRHRLRAASSWRSFIATCSLPVSLFCWTPACVPAYTLTNGNSTPASPHPCDYGIMAQSAERLLMNEFKALSKETWTNIEVCRPGCLSTYAA